MNWISCRKSISLIFLASVSFCCYSQDSIIMQRLELLYSYETTNADKKIDTRLQIARLYKQQGLYQEALSELNKVDLNKIENKTADQFRYELAFCYFMTDSNEMSLKNFRAIDKQNFKSDSLKNLLALHVMNFNHLSEFDSAEKNLKHVLIYFDYDTAGVSKAYTFEKQKKIFSIKKAANLSRIIPGSGLFYVNEPKKGIASTLINFFFIGYTAYSIYSGYYFTSVLTGGFQFMRFYGGGIKSAVRIADVKNKEQLSNSIYMLNKLCLNRLNL